MRKELKLFYKVVSVGTIFWFLLILGTLVCSVFPYIFSELNKQSFHLLPIFYLYE